MPEQSIPYLCGGVFLTHLMKAHPSRKGVREHYMGEHDGLSDPETMLAFIQVMSPDFTAPAGGTFKENTSAYKNCRKECGTYLPFSEDSAEVHAFDECVRNDYQTALSRMAAFADGFLDVDTTSKKDERLVKTLVEIIRDDIIPDTDMFYINEDGSPSTREQILAATEICFQPFLVGVWHYILFHRPTNILGRSTITDWKPTLLGTHIERVYPCKGHKDAAEAKRTEDTDIPPVEAEIVDDVPKSDESPRSEKTEAASQAKKQVIMNNYGKGVQIEELNGTLTININ